METALGEAWLQARDAVGLQQTRSPGTDAPGLVTCFSIHYCALACTSLLADSCSRAEACRAPRLPTIAQTRFGHVGLLIVKDRASPLPSHLETVHGCLETAVTLHLRVQHGMPLDAALFRASLACFVLSARGVALYGRSERKEQAHAIYKRIRLRAESGATTLSLDTSPSDAHGHNPGAWPKPGARARHRRTFSGGGGFWRQSL